MEISGANEINRVLREANSNFDEEANKALDRVVNKLLRKVKLKTPFDKGQLRRSWRRKKKSGFERLVYNNTEYAQYVEYGHRTKNGGVVDGQYMLTKSVEKLQREIDEEFGIMMDDLLDW